MSSRALPSPGLRSDLGAVAVLVALAAGLTACTTGRVASPPSASPAPAADRTAGVPTGPVPVQILAFADFHGNLEPVTDRTLGKVGGAAYLASHLRRARERAPVSFTVADGDTIGGSPLLSGAFHDEPTIEAMNLIGITAFSVGNHELDEGMDELLRIDRGGCLDDGPGRQHQDSCPDGQFAGADGPYLAANVVRARTGATVLPPYTIAEVAGVRVAFIGIVTKETASFVSAAGIRGLEFRDEVQSANALVPEIEAQGVKAIVALVHEGGDPVAAEEGAAVCDGGRSLTGRIVSIARALDPQIDLVISGHAHTEFVCSFADPSGAPRLVTAASSHGKRYTEARALFDIGSGDFVRASFAADNRVVTHDVEPAPDVLALVDVHSTLVGPIASRPVGAITRDVPHDRTAPATTPAGGLVADAALADPSVVHDGKVPVLAFANTGGVRAGLAFASAKGEGDGVVTYEEVFSVLPFNNYVVSSTLTGRQILAALEQQWSGRDGPPQILQVSKGFAYRYRRDESGLHLVDGSVTLDGRPLDPDGSYRVAMPSFLADAGDGFTALAGGTDVYYGGLDLDGLLAYLEANSPYDPSMADTAARVAEAP